MKLFRFFSGSSSKPKDVAGRFSFLGADMHNHLIPGIDDGSQSVEDSIDFIRTLHMLGYQKFTCTPHILSDLYRNSRETIEPPYEKLKAKLEEEQIPVEIQFAAEFMVDDAFEDILKNDRLLPIGGKYVLIEMSFMAPSPNIQQIIFDIQVKGYQPILAHPERYGYFHENFQPLYDFIEKGCLLQLNILSLTGAYGKEVKRAAERLIKEKLVSFAGTDLHHDRHLSMLQQMAGDDKMMNLLQEIEWKNSSLLQANTV